MSGFDFSISSLFAGFLFGVIGFYLLRSAKRRGNLYWVPIGIGLMVYPYFVSSAWLNWGIGILLCGLAYLLRWM